MIEERFELKTKSFKVYLITMVSIMHDRSSVVDHPHDYYLWPGSVGVSLILRVITGKLITSKICIKNL